MPFLSDLFDLGHFREMCKENYIRVQQHPLFYLSIANYTEKTTFDKKWNNVTRQCRGLIYNHHAEVVARPFDKFFNYGEWDFIDDSYRNSHCVVTDKLDGSLGILYPTPTGEWAIATRGSFTSDQAKHATALLQSLYTRPGAKRHWVPSPDFTYMFEIIYPKNRIVCDYGDTDDLFLIGMRNIQHGYTLSGIDVAGDWPGPRTEVLKYTTFGQAIEAPPRKGKEGMVVHFAEKDERLKLKQDDYVRLHRIVTGLNERRIWECLSKGMNDDEILIPLPEEFAHWAQKVIDDLKEKHSALYWEIVHKYEDIKRELSVEMPPEEWTRKDFALKASKYRYAGYLFMLLDKKPISRAIWAELKPAYGPGPYTGSEDTA
jgi:RNA ligase